MNTRRLHVRTVIGAAAVVALAALSLQGCAVVNGSGDDPNTLRVMMGADTTYPKERKQWQQDVAAEFQRTTGAKVQWETYSSAQEELTAIQTSVISGQGPDVYAIGSTFTPTAYATGAFVEMGSKEWKAVGGKDQFDPASFGISGPSTSKQIGIPFASRPFVMAVNKDLLAKAGITRMPTTWDELTADAKATTSGDVHGMAIAYADGFDPWKFIWGMAQNAGNTIVSGNGKAEIDTKAVQNAYRTYFDWVTKDGVVDKAAIGWNNAQALAQFTEGKAAFFPMTTTTAINSFTNTPVDGKYEFALLPTVPPERRRVRVTGSRPRASSPATTGSSRTTARSRTCRSTSSSSSARRRPSWSTTGSSATCPRTPTPRPSWRPTTRNSPRSSRPGSSRSPPPSPAPGPTSSCRSSTSSCSPSRSSRAARSPTTSSGSVCRTRSRTPSPR